MQPRFNRKRA